MAQDRGDENLLSSPEIAMDYIIFIVEFSPLELFSREIANLFENFPTVRQNCGEIANCIQQPGVVDVEL
jgi:hypothetical protein